MSKKEVLATRHASLNSLPHHQARFHQVMVKIPSHLVAAGVEAAVGAAEAAVAAVAALVVQALAMRMRGPGKPRRLSFLKLLGRQQSFQGGEEPSAT